ncbi:MAG: SusC/RagA family TonB-linked outer membrane protein, partial [Mucilaginibacter sp.]|nr:SusC/RagA family TonB-linked outer membrane protein [Mucilaginibacter sp.]
RLNYNFDNKYIVNLTATRDGSSRFGPGKQFGNFASVGAAWIFSEENWVKNHLDFLSFGKLRGSYGLTGSDQISDYQYLTRITSNGTIPYQSGPSYVPTQLANPDLHWQTNKKLEAAIDLGFLKDRLTINISVYKNRISDQLVGANLSTITGFSSVTENFPATVQNSGIEGTLNFKVIDRKDFDWTINFDVGRGWNKLVAFPNLKQSPYGSFLTIGQSLTTSYLLHYTGINPQTGLYTFQDKNKDGQLVSVLDVNRTLSDLYPVDLSQKLAGGFSSDFIYKGWELDLYFNFKTQTLPGSLANTYAGEVNTNQSTQVLNRWQYPGDITQYPKFTTTGSDRSYQNFRQSDGAFSDGSYIKLRNAVLSYDLPAKWVKKIGMQRCKINITAQNFLTFTKYNGVDPDVAGFGTTLPPAKIITGGIQFTY